MSTALQGVLEQVTTTAHGIWETLLESCWGPLVQKASKLFGSLGGQGPSSKSQGDFKHLIGTEIADDDEAEVITDEQIRRMTQKGPSNASKGRPGLSSAGGVFDDEDDDDDDQHVTRSAVIKNSSTSAKPNSKAEGESQTNTSPGKAQPVEAPDLLGVDKIMT